jgi:3-phenylpropionate/trans-cinnamate dioxygenase ferredoxin reductase component
VAASELAFALRRNGYGHPITIIGDEPHPPYQRPPLSKAYMAGEVRVESLQARAMSAYEKAGVEVVTAVRAERIDRGANAVALSDGRVLPYSTLVLALGGRARKMSALLPGTREDLDNLHTVRTIEDVDRLRAQLAPGKRLVIIGAGYLGLEFASVGIKLGLKVSVLECLPRVLARVTAPTMSAFFEEVHRGAGVDLRTGVQVTGFELTQDGHAITAVNCGDGGKVLADAVIAGVGMIPNADLAASAGLEVDDGIIVDASCRTSDPRIFAIGDCSKAPSGIDGERLRLESVPNALDQARVAAAAICEKAAPRLTVPWFWSDQYDLKLQIAGISRGHEDVVVRGSMQDRRFSVLYLKGGRVIAADSINSPADFSGARALIALGRTIDAGRIADASLTLASLA